MTRRAMSNTLALAGLALALVVSFGPTYLFGQTMVINVSGARAEEGVVHVLVYDKAQAFEDGSYDLAGFASRDASDPLVFRLSGMRPGRYAVFVHHDENANDAFDQEGALPSEGWGYSNNVGQVDVPTFASAALTFDKGADPINITMVYAE